MHGMPTRLCTSTHQRPHPYSLPPTLAHPTNTGPDAVCGRNGTSVALTDGSVTCGCASQYYTASGSAAACSQRVSVAACTSQASPSASVLSTNGTALSGASVNATSGFVFLNLTLPMVASRVYTTVGLGSCASALSIASLNVCVGACFSLVICAFPRVCALIGRICIYGVKCAETCTSLTAGSQRKCTQQVSTSNASPCVDRWIVGVPVSALLRCGFTMTSGVSIGGVLYQRFSGVLNVSFTDTVSLGTFTCLSTVLACLRGCLRACARGLVFRGSPCAAAV